MALSPAGRLENSLMADIELTVRQAAKELRISERSVRRYLATGKLEGRLVDRESLKPIWRVSAASVRRLVKPQDSATGQAAGKDVSDLVAEVRMLREEGAQYREQIERLTMAFEDLKRSLPPVKVEEPAEEKPEVKVSWWVKLFRGKV